MPPLKPWRIMPVPPPTQGQGKGSGGGFGMTARPVGAFIIRDGELTWRPRLDGLPTTAVAG
jgi:hypothetical protein